MPHSIPARQTESLAHATTWRIAADRELLLDQPRLIGILNVTPDSFSDGGQFADDAEAVEHALAMIEAGACIIDIGGESTRPGATRIGAAEQCHRVIPVIEALRSQSDVLISIDTTLADVARPALDAGANIINDVSAAREDATMLALAARSKCGLILMHRLHAPAQDNYSDQYDAPPEYDNENVTATVREFLVHAAERARSAGVDPANICIDPGLGFGKTVAQNYELLSAAEIFLCTGFPVLCAASRKSFIGAASGITDPALRVHGSVAIAVAQYLAGVRLFRVHDVAAHQQALAIASAIPTAC